jgi:cell division transport system permease protein
MKYQGYFFKESLKGFRKAKFSTLASVFTIAVSIVLISVYLFISLNSAKLIKSIKDKVELEAFLDDDIKTDELTDVKDKIKIIGGIKTISFVSKDSAKKIFEREYGKDMLEMFDGNPLPASFKVNLYEEYKSLERMNKIKTQIAAIPKVNDVVFPEKNLELIEKNTSTFLTSSFVIFILIALISIFLVSNTIRLVISAKKRNIETMSLLGASKFFIKAPYLLEGFIQGLLGGLIALGIIYLLSLYIKSVAEGTEIEIFSIDYISILLAVGCFLGVAGSLISVNKFLKIKSKH